MSIKSYQVRLCPSCGLRYPWSIGHPFGTRCPACLSSTKVVATQVISDTDLRIGQKAAVRVEALLDNIRSAWNVGSIIRTAEGFGLFGVHLCGITPTPENGIVRSTALGAEKMIPCTYHKNAVAAASAMQAGGYQLWVLETRRDAIAINTLPPIVTKADSKIIIAVGNEVTGVDPGLTSRCDKLIGIPMRGGKRSFNVAVAFGIALGQLLLEQSI